MIIGISGKIGSGKDTVGDMMKFIFPRINQFGADKLNFSYKDYLSHSEGIKALRDSGVLELMIHANDPFVNEKSKFEIKKFASKLKQIVSLLTGIPVEELEKHDVKNSYLPEEWSYLLDFDGTEFKRKHPSDWSKDVELNRIKRYTYRDLLQRIGTELFRNQLHENVWLNSLFSDYKPESDNWIITDVRFKNEADIVRNKGGILIRINRTIDILSNSAILNHPSETALDNYNGFHFTINNNYDLESLFDGVKLICKGLCTYNNAIGIK